MRRAEEQMAAGAWRKADRGENLVKVPPAPCEVCGQPSEAPGHNGLSVENPADLCASCQAAGWRRRRCACGRPLHTRDYGSNQKTCTRGNACGACRASVAATHFGVCARPRRRVGYASSREAP
jgi:hypothetical protein